MNGRVLSLCDFTGNMVKPWVEAGYEATLVDIKHDGWRQNGPLTTMATDVREWDHTEGWDIVFAFPPCTDLANSGARWFKEKGMGALIEALQIVEACRRICEASGAPWMLENPVGQLSTYWRKPNYTFDPCDYGDPYTKKTCLWTGGGFVMPWRYRVKASEGSKMHWMPPSADRADLRSATPMGFARAVFEINATVPFDYGDGVTRPNWSPDKHRHYGNHQPS
jgi:hypothetical protein